MSYHAKPARRVLPFVFGSGLAALLAVGVMYQLIMSYDAELTELQRPPATLAVVLARVDLPPGVALTEQDLVVRQIETEWVPDQVFHDVSALLNRVPAERIMAGEFVRAERLADPAGGVGLDAIIPRGQRALSVGITNGAAVSGLVDPGNFVDVLVTLPSERLEEKRTVTLLQALRVLAVNGRVGQHDDEGGGRDGRAHKPSVMLAVTPEQAEMIAHASNAGVLTLTLRTDIDLQHRDSAGITATSLIGRPEQVVTFHDIKPRRPPPPVVVTNGTLMLFRGVKGEVLEVAPDGTLIVPK